MYTLGRVGQSSYSLSQRPMLIWRTFCSKSSSSIRIYEALTERPTRVCSGTVQPFHVPLLDSAWHEVSRPSSNLPRAPIEEGPSSRGRSNPGWYQRSFRSTEPHHPTCLAACRLHLSFTNPCLITNGPRNPRHGQSRPASYSERAPYRQGTPFPFGPLPFQNSSAVHGEEEMVNGLPSHSCVSKSEQ